MASKVDFPIRTKLLLLSTLLVLGATASYLALAIKLFKDDKTALIYELNASTVKTLAAESEAELFKIADKVKLLTQGHRDPAWTRAVLQAEPDLISYKLFQASPQASQWSEIAKIKNPDYLKLYGVSEWKEPEIPFSKVLAKKSLVINSTSSSGVPVLTLALAVEIQGDAKDADRIPYIAVVDLKMDRLLRLLQGRGLSTAFIVDSEGHIVAHPDSGLVKSHAVFSDHALVQAAVDAPVALQVKPFTWHGKSWLGAYASVGIGGLSVISEVEEGEAFRAVRKLAEKSVLFALLVITAGVLLSGWLSRTFTDSIEKLTAATGRLSHGDFTETVHVKSRDEMGSLARAFNAMSSELQSQRRQIETNQAELERKVKERTLALESQKKQLAESQDSLIRTTRLASLGELAGAAAHEVLNPINNMNIRVERIKDLLSTIESDDSKLLTEILTAWSKTYSEGGWHAFETELKKSAQDPSKKLIDEDLENLTAIARDSARRMLERREDMDFLSKEITRVTRIINNMRSLSRVGGERKPLDIHTPIEETRITLADLFEKRKVTFIKDYSSDTRELFSIIGDKDELVQVFSNLIRNGLHAIDFAKRRAGTIKVSTRRIGDRVEVRVADNGTGIPAEHLPRIFEPTFTTKSVDEGTGLGLSISRRLVRAFSGDIEIEKATEGEGTTFLIWFPATVS